MKAISGLPARGVPMLPAVGACRHSRQGSLLQIPSSGGKLGSEGRSSGGCRINGAINGLASAVTAGKRHSKSSSRIYDVARKMRMRGAGLIVGHFCKEPRLWEHCP
jgi:hypothetical protein